MTTGVLTSETVPVNWTIEGTADSGLRQSLYVQMQAAYNAIDQLGYHQAASLLTAQLTDEVNALSKRFANGTWNADSNQDAFDVSKALMISGLSVTDLHANAAAFYTTSVPGGVLDETLRFADLPPQTSDIDFAGALLDVDEEFEKRINELINDPAYTGKLVQIRGVFSDDGPDGSVLHLGTFLVGSGNYHELAPPFSATTTVEVAADNSFTVPDDVLPGDILKTNANPPQYYVVDVARSVNLIGNMTDSSRPSNHVGDDTIRYFPIAKSADQTRIDLWDQKLSQAINELTRNGQIEAARLQQLVNLLQNLLAGASNIEAKETRVKESILSKL